MSIISINSRMTVIAVFKCRISIFHIRVSDTAKICTPNNPELVWVSHGVEGNAEKSTDFLYWNQVLGKIMLMETVCKPCLKILKCKMSWHSQKLQNTICQQYMLRL